jgi:hypothetical protein
MNRVMYLKLLEATGGMKHDPDKMKGMNHSKMGKEEEKNKMGDMKGMDHSMMEMGNQTSSSLNYSMLNPPIKRCFH